MSRSTSPRCQVRFGIKRCGSPCTSNLPLCDRCLDDLLAEVDPGRRRSLSTWPQLPHPVIELLATDQDAHVRAALAARTDLPTALAARLADPTVEPSPLVWRGLASTPRVREVAERLATCDDTRTLLALALNVDTPRAVLDRLVGHSTLEVATAAIGARAGLRPTPGPTTATDVVPRRAITSPPDGAHARRVRRAAALPGAQGVDASVNGEAVAAPSTVQTAAAPAPPSTTATPAASGRPIRPWQPETGVPQAVADPSTTSRPSHATPSRRSGRKILHFSIASAGALTCGVALGLYLAPAHTNRDAVPGPSPLVATAPTLPATSQASPKSTSTTPTSTSSTLPPTTTTRTGATTPSAASPSTAAPVPYQAPEPASSPATSARQVEVPAPPSGPMSRTITVTSARRSFCGSVRVAVNFSPSPAKVTIVDATGHTVATWSGASGGTRTVELTSPSRTLAITVSADASSLSASASASGNSC